MGMSQTETQAIENRFLAIERVLNNIQTALNNLATKAQSKSLLNIRQSEIEEIKKLIEQLLLTGNAGLVNAHENSQIAHNSIYYTKTQLDYGQLDNRYYTESEFVNSSGGISDAGKPVKLNTLGQVDHSMISLLAENHSTLSGLDNDDHLQYFNNTRADTWLSNKTTDNLTEGTSLYFLNERAQDAIGSIVSNEFVYSDETPSISLNYNNISHLSIQDIGTNTHSGIDNHISDSSIHFTQDNINHGTISGLSNDDHTQYHTDARGDSRYYTQTQLNNGQLDNRYYTESEVDNLVSGIVTDHSDLTGLDGDDHLQYLTSGRADTWLSNKSLDDLDDVSISNPVSGQNISYDGNAWINTNSITLDHSDLSGLSNDDHLQYLTSGRADTWLTAKSTSDLTEGSNLYFTEEKSIEALGKVVLEPTGFPNRVDSSIAYSSGSFSIDKTGSSFSFYIHGIEFTKTSIQSLPIPDVTGKYFIYFDDTGSLAYSLTSWNFDDEKAPVAILYRRTGGSDYLLFDERHGLSMDWATHSYLHQTVNTRYGNGLTGTFNNNNTLSITEGTIYDEDLQHDITTQTNCRVLYQDGGSGWYFDTAGTGYFKEVASIIQYDNGTGTPADVPTTQYVAYWIFATNDVNYPIFSIMGQRVDNTIAQARNNNLTTSLNLSALPSAEMKLLYRVILRRSGTSETVEDVTDYRNVSNLPVANFIPTDHGSLTGLSDDDHTQYVLSDGTRIITGNQQFDGLIQLVGSTSSYPALKRNSTSVEVRLADDSDRGNILASTIGLSGYLYVGATQQIEFATRSRLYSDADGNIRFSDSAGSTFGLLQLGGTTSSFPALKRNTTGIDVRLADDSGYAPLGVGAITSSSNIYAAFNSMIGWSSGTLMRCMTNGNIRLTNSGSNDFGLLQFGGITSSYPAIKRNTTGIDIRLADDSAYTNVTMKSLYADDFTSYLVTGTNYERGVIKWSSSIFTIAAERGGSGSNRVVDIKNTYGTGLRLNNGKLTLLGHSSNIHYIYPDDLNVKLLLQGTFSNSAGTCVGVNSYATLSASSGEQTVLSIEPTIAHTGTASYNGLLVTITENSVGSGTKRLISAKVNSAVKFIVENDGTVVVGSSASTASTQLDLQRTDGALLLPRLTEVQRDALTAANGMLIYNTTAGKFQGREAGAWVNLI